MPISERELAARNRQLHETGGYRDFNSLPEELKNEVVMRALQNFRTGRPATQENYNRMREIMASNSNYAMQQMRTLGLAREGGDDYQGRDYQLAYGRGEFSEDGEPMGQAAPEQSRQASAPIPPQRSESSSSAPIPPDPSGANTAREAAGARELEEVENFDESSGGMMDQLLAGAGAGTAAYLLSRYLQGNRGAMQMPEDVRGGDNVARLAPPMMQIEDAEVPRSRTVPPDASGIEDPIEEAVWRYTTGEPTDPTALLEESQSPQRNDPRMQGRSEEAARARNEFAQAAQEPEARPAAETPDVIRQGGPVSDPDRAALDHFLMKTILAEEATRNSETAGQRARSAATRRVRTP